MQQTTFGEIVGLEPLVPVKRMPTVEMMLGGPDEYFDIEGNPVEDEESVFEANADCVKKILDAECEWYEDYVKGDDYGSEYAYIAGECGRTDWHDDVAEWVENNYSNYAGFDDWSGEMTRAIIDGVDLRNECEAIYGPNEYAAYSGDGVCVYSLDIGECEHQIDVSYHPILDELNDRGELEAILEDVEGSGDWGLHNHARWDAKRGRRDGTEYVHGGCLSMYVSPGGQWYLVIPHSRIEELAEEFLTDRNGSDELGALPE